MANLREIRGRIAGVRSTSKITQAMKLVAAAKLRRAQDGILSARPYARKLRSLIGHLLNKVELDILPILQTRTEVRNVLIIVVTADRGMCGAFNANIIKRANQLIQEIHQESSGQVAIHLKCIGKRGVQFFQKTTQHVVDTHVGLVGAASFVTIQSIMNSIITQYLSGEYDKVYVVYNEFKSVIQQIVTAEQILPLSKETLNPGKQDDEHFVDYIYEPSETELLERLIPRHLHFHLWRVLLESNASEQGARMTAMDNATTNARDLIDTLQLEYNSLRQEKITTELLEIVAGAEALKKSS